jgi:integrase
VSPVVTSHAGGSAVKAAEPLQALVVTQGLPLAAEALESPPGGGGGASPHVADQPVSVGSRAVAKDAGLVSTKWTPRELRHSFVSLLSSSGVPIEDISRLVGHVSTSVTEKVYRHELRPMMTRGATAMDGIFRLAMDAREATEES